MQSITCYPNTIIYIFCPAGSATGGPEALHQLGHHLNSLGFNTHMHYYSTPDGVDKAHDSYKKYNVPFVNVLENKPEHIMIMPETYLAPAFKRRFSEIRKMAWWLSVTNFYITEKDYHTPQKQGLFFKMKKAFSGSEATVYDKLKKQGVSVIGHSYFSMVHLRENGIEPIGQISDYMNDAFFELADNDVKKEDIIIYNPKKNDEFLTEIISLTPQLNWKPLEGMTPKQVAGWMNKAKVYIDFGYHPGKERMPREACIMQCCMVIGKTGSAAYQPDMPIPDKYRFEKKREGIPAVIKSIEDCLTNYDSLISDFAPYRQVLYGEKEKFIADIQQVFAKS